jgi:hypothetical protein
MRLVMLDVRTHNMNSKIDIFAVAEVRGLKLHPAALGLEQR